MRVKKVAAPNMASLPPKKTKTKRNSQMKAIQSYTHVENIFLCFAFVCLVVLPKIWLASSYVFSGHYLTGTMFIVIATKPKIKKKTKITKIWILCCDIDSDSDSDSDVKKVSTSMQMMPD